ncbi:MAG: carboxypeptidase regulatory-like domain-containing protein [Planctomycetes bacterium]|nr:carboxypeptidase regulatory-like domain-containing protein [Planctomycetota bacterium]MBL7038504.1 carboxypeptidase regulatory-like domain-containing protein [Pirellulaceae bacterium]
MKRASQCRYQWRMCLLAGSVALLVGWVQPTWAAGAGVHGRVHAVTESGKYTGVVASAAIEITNQAGVVVARTNSGETGYYRIELPPGQYLYKVTAAGYKDEDKGRGFALQLTTGLAVYDFTLTKGKNDPDRKPPSIPKVPIGLLRGHVFEKSSGGTLIGIPDATITLRKEESLRLDRVVTGRAELDVKDSAGAYQVALAVGGWRASVSADGFEMQVDPQPIGILPGKEVVRDYVLIRERPEEPKEQGITGVISLVTSGDTKQITPSDVKVTIFPLSNRLGSGPGLQPDNQGKYSRDLAIGRYRVVAEAEGYRTARSRPAHVFLERYTVVNLNLTPETKPEPPPAALVFEGRVGTRVGTSVRLLQGAKVRLIRQGQPLSGAEIHSTDERGAVHVEVAEAGQYVFLAQMTGYQTKVTRVTIGDQERNSAAVLLWKEKPIGPQPDPTPTPPSRLVDVTGYVVYKSSRSSTGYQGVEGSQLTWRLARMARRVQRTASAAANGQYSLQLPLGTHKVEVKPPDGFRGTSEVVDVTRGMKPKFFVLARIPVTTPPTVDPPSSELVTVTGTLRRSSNGRYSGIPNVLVGWTSSGAAHSVRTTSAGTFSVRLPRGQYRVTANVKGYKRLDKSVLVRRPMRPVSLVLTQTTSPRDLSPVNPPPRTSTLTLRIVENSSTTRSVAWILRPVDAANVVIRRDSRTVATGRTSKDGVYSARLSPGTYRIHVSRNGYSSIQQSVSISTSNIRRDIVLKKLPTRYNPLPGKRPVFNPLPGRPPVFNPLPGKRPVFKPQPGRPPVFKPPYKFPVAPSRNKK